ncbi:TlpA family protein disulfide reductase [Sphingobacterium mizutaii]|uniref:TlpA family protein disulfide reductase n=1 Tax=Sphingobacterium mizutaii TaxID=1010 RepID=UPI0016252982|nr:TlpA disulfide reductase family protein [Sphingobacterium mizutaii]
MKVTINMAVFFLLLYSNLSIGWAQAVLTKEIKVGDKVPGYILEIINKKQTGLSKPTILNFWATWCVPCIRELKLLDSVQKETNDVNIFSVTYESEQKTRSFFENNEFLKSNILKIINSDTLLHRSFPHRIIPHNIWIDADGIVQYITGSEEMIRDNIYSFMRGDRIKIQEKKDIVNFDPFAPFRLSDSSYRYRSILTKSINGIFSGVSVQKVGNEANRNIIRLFSFNESLSGLLWQAINQGRSPKDYYHLMNIETSDSLRFYWPSSAPVSFRKSKYKTKNDWVADNAYCYELTLPFPVKDSIFYKYMLNDLIRNFDIQIDVIEDSIPCSIITLSSRSIPFVQNRDSSYISLTDKGLIAKNVSILYLLDYLNEKAKEKISDRPDDPPYIDKTGGKKIDVEIEFVNGMPSYRSLKKILEEKYGIMVRKGIERYNKFIVKDSGD